MLRRQKIERMTRWKGDDEKRREETRWRMDNRKSARRKVDERGATERHERMLEARDGRETRRKRAGTRTRTKRDETETDRESAGAGRDGQIERLFGGEWMLASLSMDHLPFLI